MNTNSTTLLRSLAASLVAVAMLSAGACSQSPQSQKAKELREQLAESRYEDAYRTSGDILANPSGYSQEVLDRAKAAHEESLRTMQAFYSENINAKIAYGDFGGALQSFSDVRKETPEFVSNNTILYRRLMRVYAQNKIFDKARETAEEVRRLSKDDADREDADAFLRKLADYEAATRRVDQLRAEVKALGEKAAVPGLGLSDTPACGMSAAKSSLSPEEQKVLDDFWNAQVTAAALESQMGVIQNLATSADNAVPEPNQQASAGSS